MENSDIHADLNKLLLRRTNLCPEDAKGIPDEMLPQIKDFLYDSARVLIIGAGGLGCEIVKNLALLGIQNIDIVDLDTIDVTNLNRQFLFRQKDVGRYKAEVAAEFIKKRCPNINIKYHTKKIQEFDDEFYKQFQVFIAGLDNIEARRWLNQTAFRLIEYDENNEPLGHTIRPIIDGGTESFSGQARVIIPHKTACFECTLDTLTKTNVFNFCTISNTPRTPEHCIAYAMMIQWDKEFPDKKYDTDSFDDMNWMFEKAYERAKEFGIEGVTYMMTTGVVKNIIPAIASTNATIAATTCNEVLKILTYCSKVMDNWMSYHGRTSINCTTYPMEKKDSCGVCGLKRMILDIPKTQTVQELVNRVTTEFSLPEGQVTIVCDNGDYIFAAHPPPLRKSHEYKLEMKLGELIEQDLIQRSQNLSIFAKGVDFNYTIVPNYQD